MKLLLSLLVVANVLLFGWLRGWMAPFGGDGREPGRLERQVAPERLRIVPGAPVPPGGSARPGASTSGAAPAGAGSVATVARAGAGGDGGAPAATAAPRDTKDARDAKDAKDAKDAAKDAKETRDPAVAPAQPGEVPSDATRTAAGAADAKPPEPSPAALLVALRAVGCVEFGPLREPDAVRLLVALDAVGAELAVSAGRADEVTAWMVFVAPRASELQTRLEALRERGVRDLYVLPEGSAWRGTVSLGLFRQEELALGLQRTIAARGVRNVRVAPRGPGAGPMTLRARPAAEPLLAELPRLRAAIPDAFARPCATARG